MPTRSELEKLKNAGSTWTANYNGTGVKGRIFGSGSNTIFLPAAGSRSELEGLDGRVLGNGKEGGYWSNEDNDPNKHAYSLHFGSAGNNVHVWRGFRTKGHLVRCVKE